MYKIMMPKNGTGDALIVMSDGGTVEAKVQTKKQSNWNVIEIETENGKKKQGKRTLRSGARAKVTPALRDAVKEYVSAHEYNQRQMAERVGHGVTTADISSIITRKLPINMLATTIDAITEVVSHRIEKG